MTLVLAYQDRGQTHDIVITDANGDTIVPGNNDNVRAMIGREGETPKLTMTGGSPTANGSSFTKNYTAGVNRLRLDASDLALIEPGIYTLFVDYYNHADGQEWKNVERQCIYIERT